MNVFGPGYSYSYSFYFGQKERTAVVFNKFTGAIPQVRLHRILKCCLSRKIRKSKFATLQVTEK